MDRCIGLQCNFHDDDDDDNDVVDDDDHDDDVDVAPR